jgi:Rad3-related DNA helicase
MCVMATAPLAPAALVTSATLLSSDRFISLLFSRRVSESFQPAFAHLYHARPGRNVKIACPAKPWKSRHLSTN